MLVLPCQLSFYKDNEEIERLIGEKTYEDIEKIINEKN